MSDKKGESRKASSPLAAALVTMACTMLFMLNNGVRSNFGLISSAVHAHTGLPEETIRLTVAMAQLLYGLSQPFFGILALKKSNAFVLGVGGILMGAGLLLIPFCNSAGLLYLSLGLLVGLAAGAILAPYLQAMTDNGLFPQGMIGLACVSGCVVLLCIWLSKKERNATVQKAEEAPEIGGMLRRAFTSGQFMHLALAFFTCGFFMAGRHVHPFRRKLRCDLAMGRGSRNGGSHTVLYGQRTR